MFRFRPHSSSYSFLNFRYSSFHVYGLTMFQIETAVKNRTNSSFHREKLIFQHFLTNTCNYLFALCDGCHLVAEPGSIWLSSMNTYEISKYLLMVGTVFRMDQKSQTFNSMRISYSTGNNSSYLNLEVLYSMLNNGHRAHCS